MTTPLRWGILGTGAIAGLFAQGLKAVPGARLVAVGSRAPSTADAFAREHGIPRAHASYAALAADPGVDVVYVATPHPFHHANALLCLDHGKHVLCEKPFTMNAAEAEVLVGRARAEGRFLMEAMWTRFLPVTARVREWLASGAIGEPRMVQCDFGFRGDPASRLLEPELGGGALLDVGCYTIAYACMVFGAPPRRVRADAALGATGVDEQVAMTLTWSDGRLAVLSAAVRTSTNRDCWIYGTEGRIHVPSFWQARSAILYREGTGPEVATPTFVGNGYNYQAEEVARCIALGRMESEGMPLAESLAVLRVMDDARRQIGLVYPTELAE